MDKPSRNNKKKRFIGAAGRNDIAWALKCRNLDDDSAKIPAIAVAEDFLAADMMKREFGRDKSWGKD